MHGPSASLCWELKYCPYGPLVEDFPGVPATAHQMEAHVAKLVAMLGEDRWWNGQPMSDAQRKDIRRQIRAIKKDDYPESVPRSLVAALCSVWGHICPVFYVQSGATETRESRRKTRSISRDTMLKVVRRDGQICQACHKPVPDNEVEFDHVIPYSRGGPSTVENLKLVHRNCNRSKGASLQALLDERGTDAMHSSIRPTGRDRLNL